MSRLAALCNSCVLGTPPPRGAAAIDEARAVWSAARALIRDPDPDATDADVADAVCFLARWRMRCADVDSDEGRACGFVATCAARMAVMDAACAPRRDATKVAAEVAAAAEVMQLAGNRDTADEMLAESARLVAFQPPETPDHAKRAVRAAAHAWHDSSTTIDWNVVAYAVTFAHSEDETLVEVDTR